MFGRKENEAELARGNSRCPKAALESIHNKNFWLKKSSWNFKIQVTIINIYYLIVEYFCCVGFHNPKWYQITTFLFLITCLSIPPKPSSNASISTIFNKSRLDKHKQGINLILWLIFWTALVWAIDQGGGFFLCLSHNCL